MSTITSRPFDGVKLKIARARKHTAELEIETARYLSRDPYVPLLIFDTQTKEHYVHALSREDVPSDMVTIFGDAIFNLRSALDILANDLVALNGAIPKKVYFPFADTKERLEDQIEEKLKMASADVKEMVRAFRPYRGGNKLLRALHDLNIRDKHVAVLGAGAGQSMIFTKDDMTEVAPGKWVADFSNLPTVPIDPTGFPVNEHGVIVGKLATAESYVHIGPDLPLAGEPIIPTLNKLVDLVQGIVDTFEAKLLGTH